MILKGSTRSGGANLAAHLMRLDENDHVRVHEMRGFAGDDLHEAFQEIHAIARGTKCQKPIFSLSLNPPEHACPTVEDFEAAINRVEEKTGLKDQPRVIVIHEKQGRIHAHCVWSRIDADTMTARPADFYKLKLQDVSRELYLQHGWQMPHGLISKGQASIDNFTLAEWQQAKRLQQDPRWIKQLVGDCWARSDNKATFERSLSEHALVLARGDRRGFVVVDHQGEVHSLSRCLGIKTKELGSRLGDPAALGSVDDAKQSIAKRLVPAMQRHILNAHIAFQKHKAKLDLARADLVQRQRDERTNLAARHKLEFESETLTRAARLPTGLRGLWHRITGKYQEVRRQNEAEAEASRLRQYAERHALVERQIEQRRGLQTQIKEARGRQATQLRELRREVGRFLTFTSAHARNTENRRAVGSPLKLQR